MNERDFLSYSRLLREVIRLIPSRLGPIRLRHEMVWSEFSCEEQDRLAGLDDFADRYLFPLCRDLVSSAMTKDPPKADTYPRYVLVGRENFHGLEGRAFTYFDDLKRRRFIKIELRNYYGVPV